ncbi:MAG: biotin/lipoyl-binding protein [Huintestinicola sp.]
MEINMMNENKTPRREVIKNITIVFLAVLLVLTFFSNTFMNYSLPQVSAVYAGSGTISEQIRGSGTVEAGEKYEVTLDQTRDVKSVAVKQGDTVKAGDVLFELEDVDSTELTQAQSELDSLELAYKTALIDLSTATGYEAEYLKISNAEAELADLRKRYENAQNNNDPLSIATSEYKELKAESDSLTKEKESINAQIASVDTEDLLDLTGDYYKRMRAAKDAVANAQTKTDSAKEKYDEISAEVSAAGDYQAEIKAKRREIESAQITLDGLYIELFNASIDGDTSSISAQISAQELTIKQLNEDLGELLQKSTSSNSLKFKLKTAKNDYESAENKLNKAKTALSEETRSIKLALKAELDSVNERLDEVTVKLADAEAEKTDLESAGALSASALSAKIAEQEQAIEDMKTELTAKQAADSSEIEKKKLDIENQEKKIEAQKALVEKYKSTAVDAVVKAKVGGIVESIAVTAGQTVASGTTAAVITVSDKGYTLSFSVKTEQAKKLKVGDKAEITSFYWGGDMGAVLAAIKPDTTNPQTNKLLEFTITGSDITTGQTLSVSIGSKGQQYSTIVPNNAVREDSNGKFVLVMEAKSSPLGNRYKAVRYDVEVLAKDDTNSAVSGLMGSEFVITTSTKPIEAGAQVRPAD